MIQTRAYVYPVALLSNSQYDTMIIQGKGQNEIHSYLAV